MIQILSKIKHHFNEETFNWEKKYLEFVIEKCKMNNGIDMMKEYKDKEMWLFFEKKRGRKKFIFKYFKKPKFCFY